MNCPRCGREMTSGYIKSARPIIWAEDDRLMSGKGFCMDEKLWKGFWRGYRVPAQLCAGCGCVLAEVNLPKNGSICE